MDKTRIVNAMKRIEVLLHDAEASLGTDHPVVRHEINNARQLAASVALLVTMEDTESPSPEAKP